MVQLTTRAIYFPKRTPMVGFWLPCHTDPRGYGSLGAAWLRTISSLVGGLLLGFGPWRSGFPFWCSMKSTKQRVPQKQTPRSLHGSHLKKCNLALGTPVAPLLGFVLSHTGAFGEMAMLGDGCVIFSCCGVDWRIGRWNHSG